MNPNAKIFDAEKSDVFHTTIAEALFLCMQEVYNIQPTVQFWGTRVKIPDEDD